MWLTIFIVVIIIVIGVIIWAYSTYGWDGLDKNLVQAVWVIGIIICISIVGPNGEHINRIINRTVKKSEIEFNKYEEKLMYKGKPFTGTIEAEKGYGNIKVEDGKPLYEEKSYQNGYRMKKYPDGTKEYYDYNNHRISAKDFYDGISK